MSNTSILRMQSYMPPKKSAAWRFENARLPDHSSSETQLVELEKIKSNMGLMSDDSEVKPVAKIQFYPTVMETYSKLEQSEDAPLDFSLKKGDNTEKKTEPVNYIMKRFDDYELKRMNMVNQSPMQITYPANMVSGNHSPPPLRNNSPTLDTSHASSSGKDSDFLDMDNSQESIKSPRRLAAFCTNGINPENSPEHRSISRENSPVSQPSLLAEMLKGQQRANFMMPSIPQTFGNGYGTGLGVYEGQVIASPSPPMVPVVHPASMLSMAQYFGYPYVEHPNPFMSGYMCKPPEPNIVDVSAGRKPKRKVDPYTDSLKTCTVEELEKKLESISGGNSLLMNSDYATNLKPTHNSQEINGGRLSNSTSHELNNAVNNSSTVSKRENGHINNSIPSHNVMKNNPIVNHNNENSTTTPDSKPNEIHSQNLDCHNQTNCTNNTANVSCTDDTNDSPPSSMPESSSDGRRRKPTADYRDDPDYRMKRAKNNLAARRSRESRRRKEELIRRTAAAYEHTNKLMARDLTTLRMSYEERNVQYFSLLKECENMKIQNSVLTERLNQKRCGQCGSALPSIN